MIQSNARNSIPRSNIMHVHSNKYGSGATLIINEVLFYLFSGSGVPNEMHRYFNGTTSISAQSVPETSDAVDMFTVQGGSLTLHGVFGYDPLRDRQDLVQHCDQYSFGDIFSDIVSSDGDLLRNAILDSLNPCSVCSVCTLHPVFITVLLLLSSKIVFLKIMIRFC